jgi:glycine cleavage system T protein (aminomethyltransferase)
MQTLLRTPLYERHVALGARMVPFAGWEMPVQYEGVIPEHRAVREDCGVFDVSHMGEFDVEGPTARPLLQSLLANDIDKAEVGDAQYTLLTNERGGIVDDLIVYRVEGGRYLLVVNAASSGSKIASIAAPTSATCPTSTRCSPSRGPTRSSGSVSARLLRSRSRWASWTGSR